MTTVRFSRADLSTWAEFSGDYNPIHFNDEAVKQFGLDGVVVHGMLAMLSLKSRVPRENWRGPWVEWKAMLKRAMPLSASYVITTAAGPGKFNLAEGESGSKNIMGTCSEVDFDPSSLPQAPEFSISQDKVAEKLATFKASYPQSTSYWVFLDALVFSEYLSVHSGTMFAQELLEYLGVPPRAQGEAPNFMAMHTYHTVTSSADLMKHALPEKAPTVQYAVVKKERVASSEAVFVLIDIPVWVDGKVEMVIEMGLMAKKL